MLLRLFSRRWLPATLLVLLAAAVLVRLGFWQLDRLQQRRAFNSRVVEQQNDDPLVLDESNLDLDLYSMEFRQVVVTGEYLPEDEIMLRNQVWPGEFGSELGVSLFTPLRIQGTDAAILVERGWIPETDVHNRKQYEEVGTVIVRGQLRRDETDFDLVAFLRPDPPLAADEPRRALWNNLDLDSVASQMDGELLPVYVQRFADGEQTRPPYALPPTLDLSEGPHLGYAIQWFSFAGLLLAGYPLYVNRQSASPC
ncbi:MAG: SURF1 family protein [Anaerolineales bacterium]